MSNHTSKWQFDQDGYYKAEEKERYWYGEIRLAGLSEERLQEVVLEMQLMLLNKGLLGYADVEIEKTNKHGEFVPIKGLAFKLKRVE